MIQQTPPSPHAKIKVCHIITSHQPFCCFFLSHFLQTNAQLHIAILILAVAKSNPKSLNAKKHYTPTPTTVSLVPEEKQPKAIFT